jgi:hypothetical protein
MSTRTQDEDGATVFEFDIDRNSELAENLKGHLMLTTGDVDNVRPEPEPERLAYCNLARRTCSFMLAYPLHSI